MENVLNCWLTLTKRILIGHLLNAEHCLLCHSHSHASDLIQFVLLL